MARKTTTVYVCDLCGKEVDRARDLTKVDLDFKRSSSYLYGAIFEVCDDDLAKFIAGLPADLQADVGEATLRP